MTDGIGPIASAVILPDVEAEAQTSPRAKRRQSSASEQAPKRSRLSHDGSADTGVVEPRESQPTEASRETEHKSKDAGSERRKSSVQEERKRGQRLFGGLLSTLSQSTPNGQQKRRQEIEKRQQEKAKLQKAADEERRAERLANLAVVRKVEQVKYNQQSMRIKHSNMQAMAQFLCTKTEPKLYYKPWELLAQDDDRVKQQIADVEALIEREVEEFNRQNPTFANGDQDSVEEKSNSASKETVGEPHVESPSVPTVPTVPTVVDTTNIPPVQEPQFSQAEAEKLALEELNGEVVVEAEEDTVIY